MIGFLIFLGFMLLAVFVSAWWYFAVGITGLLLASQWYRHNGRPWRKVHFKSMLQYAACLGYEDSKSKAEGRPFEVKRALQDLVKMARPDWHIIQIDEFIEREYTRCENYYDASHIRHELVRITKKMPDNSEISQSVDSAKRTFKTSNDPLMVRMIIAGLIEEQYGPEHRGEYMLNVIRGKAT